MSDASVSAALASSARLVVIEAPAGCGKTYRAAEYARSIAQTIGGGRALILTHTHAACDVFASRTRGVQGRIDIRTIDSMIGQVAAAYHSSLGLPADTGRWARTTDDGYSQLAAKATRLLETSRLIARSLAQRYPTVVCDEHQDASADQHAMIMALHDAGAAVRVFGDPMQRIYGRNRKKTEIEADSNRWERLKEQADVFDELDEPHRWRHGSESLGRWILAARAALRAGGSVDLRGPLPPGVRVLSAENRSPRPGGYNLSKDDRRPIDRVVDSSEALLVLAAHNQTVDALHAFFGRRIHIWEGHVREHLSTLVSRAQEHSGNPPEISQAAVEFVSCVATGFSRSGFGDCLVSEVSGGCIAKRKGKPASLQLLGRLILEQPNHKGLAKMLLRLYSMIKSDPVFKQIRIDYYREFWDAVHLGRFDDPDDGFAETSRRRCYVRPLPPSKTISTIHKAKGLECGDVVIMPCDRKHFGNTSAARRLLYVAMSRAVQSLTFVVSRENPSPLITL